MPPKSQVGYVDENRKAYYAHDLAARVRIKMTLIDSVNKYPSIARKCGAWFSAIYSGGCRGSGVPKYCRGTKER
ncbi:hypothetical protein SNOG_08484 [Parastagonospora nodorum SN15]|uniref:Uncharacterized protein n=1 Tax=Phaeosphaeria nodorum (strain SN15 / ATCC MYA-4574 / FGSC 10173) TaxID=321614 RepID=Q0UID0_PHANO|nr:hypothetical protein SNOG_08484 [Parastagonospora nodorum SN15]EAT83652.1 hypothetical protein SNOG_08484 [Parastagonospora nodorum SN15]